MNRIDALAAILNDPERSESERLAARRALEHISNRGDHSERETASSALKRVTGTEDGFSPDAAALLANVGRSELFEVTAPEIDAYCETHGITSERRTALVSERAEYRTPPGAILRLNLADPATPIEWAVLLHWRNTYESTTRPRVERFAIRIVEMLASYPKVPADVRAAAGGFLVRLARIKPGEPVPAISLPDAEQWRSMSNDDLYARMEEMRSLFVEASNLG